MLWLTILFSRIASLFRREQSDRLLDEEMRCHIELMADEYMRRGMTPKEAWRAARQAFGGIDQTKEKYRYQRGLPMIETMWQDLRYAFRVLTKNKGFTIVAIVALALGIGANTAIFSVVDGVLLRPLPFKEPDKLFTLWERNQKILHPYDSNPPAIGNLVDWRAQNHVFESIASYYPNVNLNLAGEDSAEHVVGAQITADLFQILRVDPIKGRIFRVEEEEIGKNRVVIISHGLWIRRYGGDPNLVGKTIMVNGVNNEVVGIMPAGFNFPGGTGTVGQITPPPADIWIPLALPPAALTQRSSHSLTAIARLKPGVTIEQAQAEMNSIQAKIEHDYPNDFVGNEVKLVSLHMQVSGPVRPVLLLLLGAVAFVLLIACVNVANLLLARAASRQKEIAIRASLGASRIRVIRQLLTESLLLSVTGGTVGVLLAGLCLKLIKLLLPANFPRAQEITLDWRVLGFTLIISLATGIIFGLVPAIQASRFTFTEALKEGGRGSTEGFRHNLLRSILVIAEVALSLILLVGAGLMVQSLVRIQQVKPGFSPDHVLTMSVSLPRATYPDNPARVSFFRRFTEQTKTIPGVLSVGATTQIPLGGDNMSYAASVDGRTYSAGAFPSADARSVTPEYFNTMKVALIKGRFLTERDNSDSPGAIVINQTMARHVFPDEDPIGKHMSLGFGGFKGEIVGVIGDVREAGLGDEINDTVYVSYLQAPFWSTMILVVRTTSEPVSMANSLRGALAAMDKNQSIFDIKTMDSIVVESVSQPRFRATLLGLFAITALLLAMVGIYGVMSYSASRRTHEIGIRMALGANPKDVLKLVVGQGLLLAVIGVFVGLAGSFLLTQFLIALLYETKATDPGTFAGMAVVLIIIATAACYIPARRASKVDPMIALRYE